MPKKIKPEPELLVPETMPYKAWLVLGLDLSVSRGGYVLYHVNTYGAVKLVIAGSLKPADTKLPVWSRCSMMSNMLLELLRPHFEWAKSYYAEGELGFMIAAEAATPRNDFLSSIHRVSNTFLLGNNGIWGGTTHTLYINASTLRSTLGLTMTGAKNKTENIERAYQFIDEEVWPSLDSDSCDAVLMGSMGVFAAQILMGNLDSVPRRFQLLLCESTLERKGSKLKPVYVMKGLFHKPQYWFPYVKQEQILIHRDASAPKKQKPTKLPILF